MHFSRLFNYLNHSVIEQNDSLEGTALDDDMGKFYDFESEARRISFEQVKNEKKNRYAVFSIVPDELTVYFCHEG